jgi:hypothetical protein
MTYKLSAMPILAIHVKSEGLVVPRLLYMERWTATNYILYLKIASLRAKIPFEWKSKQFKDADFCIRETIVQVLLGGEGSNSKKQLQRPKLKTSF